jgi:TPR repeat protein
LPDDQGHAKAQTNLGVMYANGEGVPQDYKKAHMWYNISAANGNESAREFRDLLAKEMTPEAVSQAQELASKWMESH